MSDIYQEQIRIKDLHKLEKHKLNNENPTNDLSCDECYPVRRVTFEMEREFLKFWKIFVEIEDRIEPNSYIWITIAAYIEATGETGIEFMKNLQRIIRSITFKEKLKYKMKGLMVIIAIIFDICIDQSIDRPEMIPRLNLVKQKVESIVELQKYGTFIDQEENEEKFEKCWHWLKLETTAKRIPSRENTLNKLKKLLYLEDGIAEDVNREFIREFQRTITYGKDNWNYPRSWNNEDLTDVIIQKFVTSKGFQGVDEWFEIEELEPDTEEEIMNEEGDMEDDFYQNIIIDLQKEKVEISQEELIRIRLILEYTPEQLSSVNFIRTYLQNAHKSDDDIKKILEEWIDISLREEIYDETKSESGDEAADGSGTKSQHSKS